jgi:hypothetical protein
LLRAHVALGLVRSGEPSSVGLLDAAYRFESDPLVRRAIVATLARRAEPGRERTLRLASDLDPDDEARALARRGLARTEARVAREGGRTAWFRVDPAPSARPTAAVVVVTSNGLALPLYPDPDGSVMLAGLPGGLAAVTLASAVPGGDSPEPRSK